MKNFESRPGSDSEKQSQAVRLFETIYPQLEDDTEFMADVQQGVAERIEPIWKISEAGELDVHALSYLEEHERAMIKPDHIIKMCRKNMEKEGVSPLTCNAWIRYLTSPDRFGSRVYPTLVRYPDFSSVESTPYPRYQEAIETLKQRTEKEWNGPDDPYVFGSPKRSHYQFNVLDKNQSGRKTLVRIYLSARDAAGAAQMIEAWTAALERNEIARKIPYKVATQPPPGGRRETIILYVQENDYNSTSREWEDAKAVQTLLVDFLKSCPPTALAEEAMPTVAEVWPGIGWAEEPWLINQIKTKSQKIKNVNVDVRESHHSFIASIIELSYEAAYAESSHQGESTDLKNLQPRAAQHFQHLLLLSGYDPNTFLHPEHQGQPPDFLRSIAE